MKLVLSKLDLTELTEVLQFVRQYVEMENKITGYEKWEDNNTTPGDGWDHSWKVETGYIWSGGDISTKDLWSVVCGDGLKIKNEEWDDGNIIDGDGWSSSCNVETGFVWSRINTNTPDVWIDKWGDGKLYIYTATNWDDGNLVDGDGCSHDWNIEVGWIWNGGSKVSKDTWYTIWGDKVHIALTEECDDGNIKDGDGWSSLWKIEQDWYWESSLTTIPYSKWTENCGDSKNLGIRDWDDGNLINGDGWDSNWKLEHGYKWSGGSRLK